MKTIISANIPITLASRLKDKTKGTRSRVITRALEAYLDDKEAFDITDIPIADLFQELYSRPELTPSQMTLLRQIYIEVRQ